MWLGLTKAVDLRPPDPVLRRILVAAVAIVLIALAIRHDYRISVRIRPSHIQNREPVAAVGAVFGGGEVSMADAHAQGLSAPNGAVKVLPVLRDVVRSRPQAQWQGSGGDDPVLRSPEDLGFISATLALRCLVILDHSPAIVGANEAQTAYGFANTRALLKRSERQTRS